jgi:hypothetical protein
MLQTNLLASYKSCLKRKNQNSSSIVKTAKTSTTPTNTMSVDRGTRF